MYQAGCSCVVCKGANAKYSRQYYRGKCQGVLPLGALISPVFTRRLVRQLLVEDFTEAEIARRLGLKNRSLRLHPERVTGTKAARIQSLFDTVMAEGPELASL